MFDKKNVVSTGSTTGKSAVFDKKDVVSTSSTTEKPVVVDKKRTVVEPVETTIKQELSIGLYVHPKMC